MTVARIPIAIAGAILLPIALGAPLAFGSDAIQPGSYCPFPQKGETPECLEPAQDQYAEFFTALAKGELSDEDAANLERDVASGPSAEAPYLAISSLSYGYYQLAQRAATNPDEDPAIVVRLQRWNELLVQAYDMGADDPSYRAAVREAALDLERRGPPVTLSCVDERGRTSDCNSTESVLRGFNRVEEQVGIRGALDRLFQRMRGGGDS
jgi:hypothetical protein